MNVTKITSGKFTFNNFAGQGVDAIRQFKIEDENGVSVRDWVIVADAYNNGEWVLNGNVQFSVFAKKKMYLSEDEGDTWTECFHETTADGERWLAGDYSFYFSDPLDPEPIMEQLVPLLGIQGIPLYSTIVNPNKPAGYAYLNNPDDDDITNSDNLRLYERAVDYTLYMDSGTFYLTWDSPYIEETAGARGVYPYDATINIELDYLSPIGTSLANMSFTKGYETEPYQFNYQTLLEQVIPSQSAQWLSKAIDTYTFINTGYISMKVSTSWKETDPGSGSTSTTETDQVEIQFDQDDLIPALINRTFRNQTSDYIKYYTPVVNDGSTVTIKNGLPESDPDYQQTSFDGIKYAADTDYEDPSISSDTWTDEAAFNTNNVLTKTYAMTEGRLNSLGAFLWGDDFAANVKMINTSPIENIIALYAFPFDLSGTDESIYLGNVDTLVQGAKISNSYNPKINVGTIDITGLYSSFLDYEPYTKLLIFLPYIGMKELDINKCIGKTLKLEYVPDLLTGICCANIYIDDVMQYTYSTQLGVSVPLSATNAGQVAGAILGNLAGTALTAISDIATKNYAGAIGSVVGGGIAAATAKVSTTTSGSASPSCWSRMTRTAFIMYDRPTYQELAMFNHTYGRMCNLSKQIGSLRGFTQITNIDLSGVAIATKEEEDEIKSLLAEGVWF